MHQLEVRWKILQKTPPGRYHSTRVCTTCICPLLGSILILDAWSLLKIPCPNIYFDPNMFQVQVELGTHLVLTRFSSEYTIHSVLIYFLATQMPTIIWGASAHDAHPMSSSVKDGQNLNYQLSLLQCCQWVFDRLFWHCLSIFDRSRSLQLCCRPDGLDRTGGPSGTRGDGLGGPSVLEHGPADGPDEGLDSLDYPSLISDIDGRFRKVDSASNPHPIHGRSQAYCEQRTYKKDE